MRSYIIDEEYGDRTGNKKNKWNQENEKKYIKEI